ncbi:MAG: FkbM family methyltransferase [Rhodospirillales bacterium]|nr:FkbM family methyltransferase [Rhodospirillales bacterium]
MNYIESFTAIRDAALVCLTERLPAVNYLIVGANDGTRGDPLFVHAGGAKWRGTLFEPLPEPFEGLRKAYAERPNAKLRNQAVVADSPGGKRTFFNVPFSTTNSSFRRDVIVKHKVYSGFEKVEEQLVEVEVDCVSVGELAAEPGFAPPDVLLTDTEGYDYRLFQAWWPLGWRPAFIEIEVIHLEEAERVALAKLIEPAGYEIFWFGTDLFALRKDMFTGAEMQVYRLLRDQTANLIGVINLLQQERAARAKV